MRTLLGSCTLVFRMIYNPICQRCQRPPSLQHCTTGRTVIMAIFRGTQWPIRHTHKFQGSASQCASCICLVQVARGYRRTLPGTLPAPLKALIEVGTPCRAPPRFPHSMLAGGLCQCVRGHICQGWHCTTGFDSQRARKGQRELN